MQTSELIERVAKRIGYWDYTNSQVFTNKDVREADILEALNDTYLERVFPIYVKENPEYYEQESYANNWAATGTVDATSTGTTLVATTAIFTSDMVDAVVYNSTDGETAKITAYTSTTTVTLDTTIGDTWDGDTIYVLSGVYTFGGDATDIYGNPKYVGIKYSSTDDDYQRCDLYGESRTRRDRRGRDQDEIYNEESPIYMLTSIKVSGLPTSAIEILPIPEVNVTNGVYMKYLQKPAALSADGDIPRLPAAHHRLLVDGAIADICEGWLEDMNKAQMYEQKFNEGLVTLVDSIAVSADEVRGMDKKARTYYFRNRKF